MKQQRLDGLADGIFAIVMTLLVLELKVPVIRGVTEPSDSALIDALAGSWTIFVSLVLSFALLFTYWRAHHFIASVYAKNLTVGLANINAIFFFLITLVPFAAHFLGEYSHSRIAITFYGVLVIAIGLTLFYMRMMVERSPKIETAVITKADRRSGYIRILFPVFSAAAAILLSYWNTTFSMILFTAAILFNVLPASSNIVHKWLDLVFSDDADLIQSNFIRAEDSRSKNAVVDTEEYICVPRSVVFDHHQFGGKDAIATEVALQNMKGDSKKGNKKSSALAPITKADLAGKPKTKRIAQAKKKIEEAVEREIAKDITEGNIEEIVVKRDVIEE